MGQTKECTGCEFWERIVGETSENKAVGFCHFAPPPRILPRSLNTGNEFPAIHARTVEDDWCREWATTAAAKQAYLDSLNDVGGEV